MLPYEIEMITGGPDHYTKIYEGIKQILDSKNKDHQQDIENCEAPAENQSVEQQLQSSSNKKQPDDPLEFDPLVKFKEHERERQRERKIKTEEQDRQQRF